MDRSNELKPCPFCGSECTVTWTEGKYGKFAFIECDLCGARSKAFGNVIDKRDERLFWDQPAFTKAIKAWNRRVRENA